MKRSTYYALGFIGFLISLSPIFSPIHEVWHWLFAVLSGRHATMAWTRVYMDFDDMTLAIVYAGIYGEVLISVLAFRFFLKRKYYDLSVIMYGYFFKFIYMILFSLINVQQIDIEIAKEIDPVYGLIPYYIWSILVISLFIWGKIIFYRIKLVKTGDNRKKVLTTR